MMQNLIGAHLWCAISYVPLFGMLLLFYYLPEHDIFRDSDRLNMTLLREENCDIGDENVPKSRFRWEVHNWSLTREKNSKILAICWELGKNPKLPKIRHQAKMYHTAK